MNRKKKISSNISTPAIKARQPITKMMTRYGFTPEMCQDKSANQLLYIVAIMVQHRRYQGVLEPDEIIRLGEMEKLVAERRQVN